MQTELGFEVEIDDTKPAARKKAVADTVCTGAELAEWLSITPAAITNLKKKGVLAVDGNGMYNLKESIQTYVRQLRSRKDPQGEKMDLEASENFWKIEDRKQRVLSWRVKYGSELADRIIQQLANGIGNLREAIRDSPKAIEAVKGMLQAIGNVNIYDIVYEISGYMDYGIDNTEEDQ